MTFVVTFEEKEYRSDGNFEAYVSKHHDNEKNGNTRQLSLVEIIAIGSCSAICVIGSAVLAWKFFVSD